MMNAVLLKIFFSIYYLNQTYLMYQALRIIWINIQMKIYSHSAFIFPDLFFSLHDTYFIVYSPYSVLAVFCLKQHSCFALDFPLFILAILHYSTYTFHMVFPLFCSSHIIIIQHVYTPRTTKWLGGILVSFHPSNFKIFIFGNFLKFVSLTLSYFDSGCDVNHYG